MKHTKHHSCRTSVNIYLFFGLISLATLINTATSRNFSHSLSPASEVNAMPELTVFGPSDFFEEAGLKYRNSISRQTKKSSPFEIYGVIEGFYGRPWTHEERLEMMRFMSEFGMQSYIYAPKDDPFHRSRWRDAYSGQARERFQELVQHAEKKGLTLWFALSPGLDMVYSSENDYQALFDKMHAMVELGIGNLALFVDDVLENLTHPEDIDRFQHLSEAHVYIANRLYRDLRQQNPDTRLLVCPTTYTNSWGDREYIRFMGEHLDPAIPIFWTGTDVAIRAITVEEAEHWGEKLQRKPLIWDNFPVNDYETWRVFLGPYEGRDPHLADAVTGIVSNPMNQPYASMIPLATMAYYYLNPTGYDPEEALERALIELFPAEAVPHVREISRLYRPAGWDEQMFSPIYTPGRALHVKTIEDELNHFEEHLVALKQIPDPGVRLRGFIQEMEPFLSQTRDDLAIIVDDPGFFIDALGFLQFRDNLQQLLARQSPAEMRLDGDLGEWSHEAFYVTRLREEVSERPPEVAFLYDDTYLYMGIRVYRNGPLHVREPFYSGDHLIAVIDMDPDSPDLHIKPHDPIFALRPSDGDLPEIKKFVLELTPFSQMGISNQPRTTLSFFYMYPASKSFKDARSRNLFERTGFAWKKTDYGYSAELAFPHQGRDRIPLNLGGIFSAYDETGDLQLNHFILSVHPYIGNMAIYPVVHRVR